MALQGAAVVLRVANAEILLDLRGEAPIAEIAAGGRAVTALQIVFKEFCRQFHHVVERGAFLLTLCVLCGGLGQGDAGHSGQHLHGLWKAQAIQFCDESEDIARFLAAEAMIPAAPVVGMEGGGFLAVEGAAGPVITLSRHRFALIPGDLAAHHLGNRQPRADIIQYVIRKSHVC